MPAKSGSAKSGGSRSAKKGKASTSRQKVQETRGDAFQSPAQRQQVTGQSKGPGPVDRKAVNEAEDRAKRQHAGREAKAQAQARGASEAEANRIYQDAYDNPDKYDIPPHLGSDEERELLEKLGKEQPGAGNKMTAGFAAQKSGKSKGSKGKGKKAGKGSKQAASASASAKAEAAGEKTTAEGKGEPSI